MQQPATQSGQYYMFYLENAQKAINLMIQKHSETNNSSALGTASLLKPQTINRATSEPPNKGGA